MRDEVVLSKANWSEERFESVFRLNELKVLFYLVRVIFLYKSQK